ncbi:sigma-54 interaction domain-containing protein [Acinetobacter towneri]|uniref:sigma-54 interaction domain-containing protein n=1 Tax=Acinetobacter TaxID=469 RepID=UPI001436BA40|nr:sigma-54 dependent transcriptional regulator [Acinetobacter towneri]MCA4814249.1 sigma-54-dependent Fis family transcriptional regulator [Acinetobacter towneri]QIV92957.1 sigma-54-dependent Fis family transcriptional regulator [Acinetobacter towneri]
MTTMYDFEQQAQLEDFLFHLQQLCPDSWLYIYDEASKTWCYEYAQASATFSGSIEKNLKNQLLNLQQPIGTLTLVDNSIALSYHHLNIRIRAENLSGRLFFMQPVVSLPVFKTTAASEQTNSNLTDFFHSHSPQMQHMYSIIERVAVTEFPVLVRGESGSGKELVAQAIHARSHRHAQVFIAINCAALNANILESELFGHVKGAFTGAIREHKGVFERAAGGTLFLDEIAEIPLELQAKLLRVLETGEFIPLGGEKSIKSNVRIITATHRALREEARLGRFRQDLLYRLRVIPIFVPPLRERKQDIPEIAAFILQQQQAQFQLTPTLSEQALAVLLNYDWPGNVRELKNTLLYALTMSAGKTQIDPQDLPDEIVHASLNLARPSTTPQPIQLPLKSSQKIDKDTLQDLLEKYQGQTELVAQALGVSRTTLWRYRKKFHL